LDGTDDGSAEAVTGDVVGLEVALDASSVSETVVFSPPGLDLSGSHITAATRTRIKARNIRNVRLCLLITIMGLL